ncbi:ABC transporter permease [Methylobacterium aquaticum]|uniref:ABC transporter permease n=1 Tax=Methylobacterium aquaticum TaxID=270351 RepID=UPI001932AC10|nr:ABC transporter permease subunit [Methylobacterium aquaticum]QRE75025.1 ABC transporter permease subunit [Methylobacterium aquaticum]
MTRERAVTLTRIAWIAGFVVLLEAVCRLHLVNPLTLIPPSEMATTLWGMLASGEIAGDIARTFSTVAVAVVLAVAIGFALGVAIHALPRVRQGLDPLLASYYSIPTFVFYPLFVAIFGLNSVPLIVLGMAFGVPAMILATLNGLDRVPRVLMRTARSYRLGRLSTLAHVVMPSALPYLLTGVKLALAYAFIGIIAGEFILADAGLGHAIAYAYDGFENRTMYALMLFVLVVVTGLNMTLHAWEGRLMRRRARA